MGRCVLLQLPRHRNHSTGRFPACSVGPVCDRLAIADPGPVRGRVTIANPKQSMGVLGSQMKSQAKAECDHDGTDDRTTGTPSCEGAATRQAWVHSSVVRAADCRSAGPWFKSGCALLCSLVLRHAMQGNEHIRRMNATTVEQLSQMGGPFGRGQQV